MKKDFHIILLSFIILSSIVKAQDAVCIYCGKIIKGSFTIVEGKKYHPEHFLCAVCNQPIKGIYTKDSEEYYHVECFRDVKGPKCAVCNKPLSGSYYIDAFQNKYHTSHEKEFSKCSNCGRLICPSLTNGGRSYGDTRNMCNICYKSAVFSDRDIDQLLQKVILKLGYMGLNLSHESVSIKGVNFYELKRLLGSKNGEDLQGFCKSEKLSSSNGKSNTKHIIYVLNGTPSITMESVIAHELMHSWIFENSKKEQSLLDNEGSCNYISYLYLRTIGDPDSQFLLSKMDNNPDPIYGKGFQNIKNKFTGKSISALLDFLETN